MVTSLRWVVRSMRPTPLSPRTGSRSRFSGHSICSMDASNECMRPATEGSGSGGPTVLFRRNGAVDQTLISEGTRVYPRPPAGMGYGIGAPVNGSLSVTVPTEGSCLYDCDEKLSQMLPASALVASGLQALVRSNVTGIRASVDR